MNSAVLTCPRCCDHQAKIGITFAQMKALEETNKTVVDSAKKKVRANMRAGWTDEKNARLIKHHETEIKMLERVEDDGPTGSRQSCMDRLRTDTSRCTRPRQPDRRKGLESPQTAAWREHRPWLSYFSST